MTIIELTQKIKFKDIARALRYYYPHPKITKKTMDRYKEIMKEVSEYEINEDKDWYFDISVAKPFKYYNKDKKKWIWLVNYGEEYYSVSGRKKKNEMFYAIEFTPWQEVANFKIKPILFNYYTSAEIVAHFLWEMTFVGFEQKTIKKEVDKLKGYLKKYK